MNSSITLDEQTHEFRGQEDVLQDNINTIKQAEWNAFDVHNYMSLTAEADKGLSREARIGNLAQDIRGGDFSLTEFREQVTAMQGGSIEDYVTENFETIRRTTGQIVREYIGKGVIVAGGLAVAGMGAAALLPTSAQAQGLPIDKSVPLAEVSVYTQNGGQAIAGAEVVLDMNQNWAETGYPDADDYVSITGSNGVAEFSDVVSVSDEDHDDLPDSWELEHFGGLQYGPADDPDNDGLDNLLELQSGRDPNVSDLQDWNPSRVHMSAPMYRLGSGEAGTIAFALPQHANHATAAFYDISGRRVSQEVDLSQLAEGSSTFVPLEGSHGNVADGVYMLAVKSEGQLRAVKMTNINHGLPGAKLERASQQEAISLGWASGELVDKAQAEANARKSMAPNKDVPSQDINVVAIHPDYQTAVQAETIFEGMNYFEVPLVPNIGTVVAQGRTGDEIGNLIPGGQWVFTNTSSGDEYIASLDDLGNWSVALPDTIPSDRVMDVRFEGDGYRAKTFTFLKSDESSATGTEFTGVDIYEQTGGQTTRDVLTYDLGHVALTFSQASAENDTILYMIRAQGNDGVVKWTEPVRKPYNRLDDQVSGEYVGDVRKAINEQSLNLVTSIEGLAGEIAHPFYESTLAIQEGNGYPSDPNGWVVAQMRNDTNAGNIRGPPPADETFTYFVGWSPIVDETGNTLTLELLEAMGLNDYISGSNHHGVNFDPDTNAITGLNNIGKVVLSVANTYQSGDFSMPVGQFSEPSSSIEGVEFQYSNNNQ